MNVVALTAFAFLVAPAALSLAAAAPGGQKAAPFHTAEILFPPETWHNHGSCIVETPQGDLLVCWFHGSGERKADDVKIEGARRAKGAKTWSKRFTMADTPGFPDTNCAMFIDPAGRLWLLWPTIQANLWESALMKYRISSDYHREGPPRWELSEVLHIKPGPEFEAEVDRRLPDLETGLKELKLNDEQRKEANDFLDAMRKHSRDKLYRRLGWMTRAHPLLLPDHRLIVPLYHDGFSCSLMALTDDWGKTWRVT